MTDDATRPVKQELRLDIRSVAVRVVRGPNAGLCAAADSDVMTIGAAVGNTLRLDDPTVSQYHLELAACATGVRVTDLGSTNGTFLGAARLERAIIEPGAELRLGHSAVCVLDSTPAVVAVHDSDQLDGLFGATPAMRRLMAQVARVARAPVPVLVTGESGTGKELVARAVHQRSARASGPFVTVNCGALTPTLVASELFGHERGAFTGADRQRRGAFERADGGTLFLDEIGELPPELQPQLLGALERRRFQRLGGQHEISVDVRVVCATHRDLRAEVNTGRFRLDLYYRIAVVVLSLPPLRERAPDVALLVEHFLREAGHAGPVATFVPPDRLAELARYPWPGNVRELRNWVEATLALGEAPTLAAAEAGSLTDDGVLTLPYKSARGQVLSRFERSYLEHLLARCEGNVSLAARHAQMDRSYLIELLQKHGLK